MMPLREILAFEASGISAKSKPSLKNKNMLKAKIFGSKLLKHVQKQLKKSKEASHVVPPPPLPPPAVEDSGEAPAAADASTEVTGIAVGMKVRICSDHYGRMSCGVEGEVKRFASNGTVQIVTEKLAVHPVGLEALSLCSSLKPPSVALSFRNITAELREAWLVKCGWDDLTSDPFEDVAKPLKSKAPVMLEYHHVRLFGCYVLWSLRMETAHRHVKIVDPELLQVWYTSLRHAVEPTDAEDVKRRWQAIVKDCTVEGSLVLLPLWHSEHWVLVVVDHGEKAVRYYDSLKVESDSCHLVADFILNELAKTKLTALEWLPGDCPHRCNGVKQGLMECGFFVCRWMEEECRHLLGEGWFSRGWLRPEQTRQLLENLFQNMLTTAKIFQERLANVALGEENVEKEHDAAAAAAKAAGEIGEITLSLKEKANADLTKGDTGVPIVFDVEEEGGLEHWAEQVLDAGLLMDAHREAVLKVKATGAGVCASCRWTSGCHRCHWAKAVRYWRNKEMRGKHLEGYGAAAKAKADKGPGGAKAAGKGKAKAKAAAGGKAHAKAKAKSVK